MTFITPPEDTDMLAQIATALKQGLMNAILWGQAHGAILAIGGIAAWLFGMERGLVGKKLKLAVGSGLLFAYVGTPLVIYYFGLVEEVWKGFVAMFLSVVTWRALKWFERLALRNFGLNQREPDAEDGREKE
jgi:hypothetical protein